MKFRFHFKHSFMIHFVLELTRVEMSPSKIRWQSRSIAKVKLWQHFKDLSNWHRSRWFCWERKQLTDLVHTNHPTIQHLGLDPDIFDSKTHHHLDIWTAFLMSEGNIIVTVNFFSIFQGLSGFTIIHMELWSNGNSFHGDTL